MRPTLHSLRPFLLERCKRPIVLERPRIAHSRSSSPSPSSLVVDIRNNLARAESHSSSRKPASHPTTPIAQLPLSSALHCCIKPLLRPRFTIRNTHLARDSRHGTTRHALLVEERPETPIRPRARRASTSPWPLLVPASHRHRTACASHSSLCACARRASTFPPRMRGRPRNSRAHCATPTALQSTRVPSAVYFLNARSLSPSLPFALPGESAHRPTPSTPSAAPARSTKLTLRAHHPRCVVNPAPRSSAADDELPHRCGHSSLRLASRRPASRAAQRLAPPPRAASIESSRTICRARPHHSNENDRTGSRKLESRFALGPALPPARDAVIAKPESPESRDRHRPLKSRSRCRSRRLAPPIFGPDREKFRGPDRRIADSEYQGLRHSPGSCDRGDEHAIRQLICGRPYR